MRLELTTTRVSDGHSDQLNYLCVKVRAYTTIRPKVMRYSSAPRSPYLFRIKISKKCTCSQLLGLRFVVQGTATPRRLFGDFRPHRFTMVAATYKRNAIYHRPAFYHLENLSISKMCAGTSQLITVHSSFFVPDDPRLSIHFIWLPAILIEQSPQAAKFNDIPSLLGGRIYHRNISKGSSPLNSTPSSLEI